MSDLRVKDMMSGLFWGGADRATGAKVHIMKVRDFSDNTQAECGVWAQAIHPNPDASVCKRCLKATEKYA